MQGPVRSQWHRRAQRSGGTKATRRVGLGSLKISIQALPCKTPVLPLLPSPEEPVRDGLLEGFCEEPRQDQRLAVNVGGRLLFLRVADISLLQARGDSVALFIGKQTHILKEPLEALVARLPRGLFVRVSPRLLVNSLKTRNLRRLCQGEWQVLLSDGSRVAPGKERAQPTAMPAQLSLRIGAVQG